MGDLIAGAHQGIQSWLTQLIAVAGVALALIGAVLAVLETTRAGTTSGAAERPLTSVRRASGQATARCRSGTPLPP